MTQAKAMLWSPDIKEHKRGRANHCVVEVAHVSPGRRAHVKSAQGLLRGVTREYGSSLARWSGR
jgi:hypothetical protein